MDLNINSSKFTAKYLPSSIDFFKIRLSSTEYE